MNLPKTILTPDAPHPKARITQVDHVGRSVQFAWLNSGNQTVDSGGSIGRLAGDAEYVGGVPVDPTDEELLAAVMGSFAVDPAELVTHFVNLTEADMNAFAKTWGYDSIARACTYIGDPNPRFNAEGIALRDWRSARWTYLDEHQGDLDPANPPSDAEFLATLPAAPARPSP